MVFKLRNKKVVVESFKTILVKIEKGILGKKYSTPECKETLYMYFESCQQQPACRQNHSLLTNYDILTSYSAVVHVFV